MNQIVKPVSASVLRGDFDPRLERDEVLSEVFSATARKRAEHPALVTPERRLTYGEVDAVTDAIARGAPGRARWRP